MPARATTPGPVKKIQMVEPGTVGSGPAGVDSADRVVSGDNDNKSAFDTACGGSTPSVGGSPREATDVGVVDEGRRFRWDYGDAVRKKSLLVHAGTPGRDVSNAPK